MSFKDLFDPIPKTVIFGVLNWGLGHATRSIPIIKFLLEQKVKIIIASDGSAAAFLKKEFPSLDHESLPAYDVRYIFESVEFSLMVQLPGVLKAIKGESKAAIDLAEKHDADMIISDSRFGFRHDRIRSVVIAHQLQLISSKIMFRTAGNIGNRRLLNRFDQCWVPDYPGSTLSGALSQKELTLPVKFIGPLSRFSKQNVEKDIDLLVVLSGPEPKRSQFSAVVKEALKDVSFTVVGVEGVVDGDIVQTNGVHPWYNYLTSDRLNDYLNRSKMVLCRAGYSSVMDLAALEKRAILIPTSGQSEQEYLAEHLNGKMGFVCLGEHQLGMIEGMVNGET